MLQTVRKFTTGPVAWLIIILIIIGMMFFGVEQYFQTRVETYVAKLDAPPSWWRTAPSEGAMGRLARAFVWDSHEVSAAEFSERFSRYREQVRAQAGDQYDAERMESLETKRVVLDALVDEKVLELVAQRDGIAVDDEQVRKAILEIDGLTQDGAFIGEDAYLIWLRSRNLTAATFQAQLARQIRVSKLHETVAETGFVSDAELERLLALQQETRDLRFVEIPRPVLEASETDEAALAAWHAANPSRYSAPETVAISYIELDATGLAVPTEPSEQELRDRYDQSLARFGAPEERMAAHILVEVPADADAAAIEAARAEAADIAERARAEGADFAALAAETSDDLGSRELGGDLGSIPRSTPGAPGLFPEAFEEAVYALEEGGVSDPVRTDQGWHVVKLTRLVPSTVQPFESVRDQLAAEFGESERERLFNEKSGALIDAILRDPNSLGSVASAMDLEVRTAAAFSRDAGEGIAALEVIREAAFARPQKDDLQVSDPIEVGQNQLVVLQVTEHTPSALRPLDEVREQVRADLEADRLAKVARERADALLERAKSGESLDALAGELGVVAQESLGVARRAGFPDPAIANEAFRLLPAPDDGTADVGLAELGGGRFALVVTTKVTPGDLAPFTDDIRAQVRAQIAQLRGEAERLAFIKALRGQFEITIAEERL